MQNRKAYPYPEIVTGEQWHVMETTDADPQARTDNLNKQMYVPMDRECEYCYVNHGRMIRRHELGHAKWSPKTIGKLTNGTRSEAIQALEEVRINYLLSTFAKLPIEEPVVCLDLIKAKASKLVHDGSIADIILYVLDNYSKDKNGDNTEQYGTVLNIFRNAVANNNELSDLRKAEIKFAKDTAISFIASLTSHKWNQKPSYRKVQKLAEKLSIVLNEFIDKPDPKDVFKPQPKPGEGACTNKNKDGDACSEESKCESCIEEESKQAGGGSNELDGSVAALEQRMRRELIEQLSYHSSDGIGRWGKMNIHTPTLTVNLQSRLHAGRAYKASDFGYNPKYINRYCIDKKIFKQKQRVKGGTILIDASGSMSFTGKDILEIMQMLPAVNIAMYNGSYNSGDLRIIARNGMRVDEQYLNKHKGRGNVIDGPALEWLATMPARRIWVSDMYVFGMSGTNSAGFNLIKECLDICTKNRIINLKNIDEVKEYALKLNEVL